MRNKWNELCTGLDPQLSDGKLWKLEKNISKEQPQTEQCNTIREPDGRFLQNGEQTLTLKEICCIQIARFSIF